MEVFSKSPDNIWHILENDTYKCTKQGFYEFPVGKGTKVCHPFYLCVQNKEQNLVELLTPLTLTKHLIDQNEANLSKTLVDQVLLFKR